MTTLLFRALLITCILLCTTGCASIAPVELPSQASPLIELGYVEGGDAPIGLFINLYGSGSEDTEARVIRWLQETNILAVAELFVLSWSAIAGIQERAVRRGLKRRSFEQGRMLPKRLGVTGHPKIERASFETVTRVP